MALLALCAATLSARPSSVYAHASVVRSDPPANAVLTAAPTQVQVWLDEAIEPGLGHLEVYSQDGRRVDNLDTQYLFDDSPSLRVTVPPLPNGTYVVTWRVVSVGDAHAVGGAFAFAIGEAVQATGLSSAPVRPDPAAAVLRWLEWLAQALLLGGLVFRSVVWSRVLQVLGGDAGAAHAVYARRVTLLADAVRAVLVVSAVGGVVFRAREVGVAPWQLLGTWWGAVWIARFVLVMGLAGFMGWGLARAEALSGQPADPTGRSVTLRAGAWRHAALLLAAGALLATTSLVSHSASIGNPWLVVVDWLHLTAGSIWLGGVGLMAVVVPAALFDLPENARRAGRAAADESFARLATGAVGALLVTGALLALAHVGGWEALLLTDYGSVFQLKLGLAVAGLLLGAANFFGGRISATARVAARSTAGGKRIEWRVGLEVLALSLVIGATVWLTDLPRALTAPRAGQDDVVAFTDLAEGVRVSMRVAPARIGGYQQFQVELRAPGSAPVENVERVEITFVPVGGGALEARAVAQPQDEGDYAVSGVYLTREGPWQLLIAVQHGGGVIYQAFDVQVGPDGVLRPPRAELPARARLLGWLERQRGGLLWPGLWLAAAAAWAGLAWKVAPRGDRRAFAGLLLPSVAAIAAAVYLLAIGA